MPEATTPVEVWFGVVNKLPLTWAKANFPYLVMLKSAPMLRRAERFTSATVTISVTCCSPGT